MNSLRPITAAIFVAFVAPPALAHITLDVKEAKVGSAYKATLKVPHGCAGAATQTIRVQIPEGYFNVKPMPHAGWKLDIAKGKYAQTYKSFGSELTEGAKEVTWSGGNLPDDNYDEFVLTGTLAESLPVGAMLYFPVVQECDKGVERWIEIPAAGKKADDYKNPAPGLKLLAK
jgi:uncharacterized protein YcnI